MLGERRVRHAARHRVGSRHQAAHGLPVGVRVGRQLELGVLDREEPQRILRAPARVAPLLGIVGGRGPSAAPR